jgi:hypothetical protein
MALRILSLELPAPNTAPTWQPPSIERPGPLMGPAVKLGEIRQGGGQCLDWEHPKGSSLLHTPMIL